MVTRKLLVAMVMMSYAGWCMGAADPHRTGLYFVTKGEPREFLLTDKVGVQHAKRKKCFTVVTVGTLLQEHNKKLKDECEVAAPGRSKHSVLGVVLLNPALGKEQFFEGHLLTAAAVKTNNVDLLGGDHKKPKCHHGNHLIPQSGDCSWAKITSRNGFAFYSLQAACANKGKSWHSYGFLSVVSAVAVAPAVNHSWGSINRRLAAMGHTHLERLFASPVQLVPQPDASKISHVAAQLVPYHQSPWAWAATGVTTLAGVTIVENAVQHMLTDATEETQQRVYNAGRIVGAVGVVGGVVLATQDNSGLAVGALGVGAVGFAIARGAKKSQL